MVAADEIDGRELHELAHQGLDPGQLPPGLALVKKVAGEGDKLRLLGRHGLYEPRVVLPELGAVQVAQLDYFETVEAPGQAGKLQREPCDGESVLRQQQQRGEKGDEDEQGGCEQAPLSHWASWSRM